MLEALFLSLVTTPSPAALAGTPANAIWVTRFDYRTPEDVVEIVRQCDEAGFDAILFQVRGNATALYDSPFEPWAEQLGGRDPGYDPLKLACQMARERGLQLHAWVNVMPAWWGGAAPSDPAQLYNRHPEWLWYDQHGKQQALSSDFYVSVNPCLPEVREYLARVIGDIAARYDVDGIHLDYIRFPNEYPATPRAGGIDYPRDARTLKLFREATGGAPDTHASEWHAWRSDAVTQTVRQIRTAVKKGRSDVVLSAAVNSVLEKGTEHFQDIERWIDESLLDCVYPMNYTPDPQVFLDRLQPWLALRREVDVVMGLRVDVGGPGSHGTRVALSRKHADGICLFAYSSLFDTRNETITSQNDAARRERELRRSIWLSLLGNASTGL